MSSYIGGSYPQDRDYVERSCHDIDASFGGPDYEPMTPHESFPEMPDTAAARAWKKRLMETIR